MYSRSILTKKFKTHYSNKLDYSAQKLYKKFPSKLTIKIRKTSQYIQWDYFFPVPVIKPIRKNIFGDFSIKAFSNVDYWILPLKSTVIWFDFINFDTVGRLEWNWNKWKLGQSRNSKLVVGDFQAIFLPKFTKFWHQKDKEDDLHSNFKFNLYLQSIHP